MRVIHSALSFFNGVSFQEATKRSSGFGKADLEGLLAEGLSAHVDSVLADDTYGVLGDSAHAVLGIFAVSSGVGSELVRHLSD